MARVRADLLLVARGFALTRAQAQATIAAGGVHADGRLVARASERLAETARITFEAAHPWVSRGGVKLAAALDAFGIDPLGRICLDIGASTGGFTDVLRQRGAARIYAVDVGRGQLDARIAADPRVVSLEGADARALTRAEIPEPPDLVTCDASFIGLAKVLPAALALAAAEADLIALVKPQFEAGPGRAGKNGVLREEIARAVAQETIAALDGLAGFAVRASAESPLRGGAGALEFLLHMRRG